MASEAEPSELEKYLSPDSRKPSLREQLPYLVAFRRVIQSTTHRNDRGEPWNAAAVLEKLYELWRERADEKGLRAQFGAKYGQRIERFVRHDRGEARADHFLLELIKRFLSAYNITVPSPEIIESLRASARDLSAILPHSRRIPFFDRQVTKMVTRLYEIKRQPEYDERPDEPVEEVYFLALQLSKKATSCCLAVLFTPSRLDVNIGLYFFATRECYMRMPDTINYTRYTMSPWRGHDLPPPTPDDNWRNRAFSPENYSPDKPGQGPLSDRFIEYYCSFEPSNDVEAFEFAREFLSHFNFDN